MFEIAFTASKVSTEWPNLGTLPKPLATAIAVYDESQYVESPSLDVGADTITTKNIRERVAELAAELSTQAHHQEARNRVRNALAWNVVTIAGELAPEMIRQTGRKFIDAVTRYTDAALALPKVITPETIIAGGAEVLTAWQAARDAAAELAVFDSWLASLAYLPAYQGHETYVWCRLFSPKDRDQAQRLKSAHQGSANDYARAINPVYFAAVRGNVSWSLNDPKRVAEIIADIEAQPIPENGWKA
ncbi:hypothetical protein [Nocardia sp. R6R-6]|uniref:hypothetical protein n=1 Tax=Nocardia sp. R6R-6 TaxID=3459303 RepID=UPI00403E2D49